jgi:hypothetical protein
MDVAIASPAFAYSVRAIQGLRTGSRVNGLLLLLAGIPVCVSIKWRNQVDEETPTAGIVIPTLRRRTSRP